MGAQIGNCKILFADSCFQEYLFVGPPQVQLVLSIFFSIEQPGPDCFIKTVSESVNYILADFIAVLTDGWTDGRNDVFRP